MKYEIWLGRDSTHYHHGVAHFDDGHTEELMASHNISIMRDSMTVGTRSDWGFPENTIRWYPAPGVVEFSIIRDVELLLHNAADYDIYIYGYAYLKPGESCEINGETNKQLYSLQRWRPVGLGRLIETSHKGKEYREAVGKYGLIVQKRCPQDLVKAYTRFLFADFLRDPDSENEGLETSEGVLSYDDAGRMIIKTKKSKYVFAYDKGDGNEG